MQRVRVRAVVAQGMLLFPLSGLAQPSDTAPLLVPAPVEKVFVPRGFDDNDNVEVIVHGHFPDTCYKTGPIKARIDEESRTINVSVQAFRYRDAKCGLRLVPFVQSVKVGLLSAGSYKVIVAGQDVGDTQPLQVGRALGAAPDDYTYAPVDSLRIDGEDGVNPTLVLSGRYPYSEVDCMVLKEIKTSTTPDGVLVVQPVVTFETGEVCGFWHGRKSFHYKLPLGAAFRGKEYLAHVRVMNGESLNQLVEVPQ